MEQGMTPPVGAMNCIPRAKRGFLLVTVLVITAVGLLFGAGALLLFRYQCQLRIDRQHELEKVYAVRSALNYIRTQGKRIPDAGKQFKYYTRSDRDLGLRVRPVDLIFPTNETRHLYMTNLPVNGGFEFPGADQYNSLRDYEVGVSEGADNYDLAKALLNEEIVEDGNMKYRGIAFADTVSTNVRWWVNIGMPGTGGWLQSAYGRRYFFYLKNYVGSTGGNRGDVIRLCIIKKVTNDEPVGRRHGWPTKAGQFALGLEISPGTKSSDGNDYTGIKLFEYNGLSKRELPLKPGSGFNESLCYMGLQIAQRRVSVFYISKQGGGRPSVIPYSFLSGDDDGVEMSKDAYEYFADGCKTDQDGNIVEAPELRAVIEVEAASDQRTGNPLGDSVRDLVTDFRVTPAYQFNVFLEHPTNKIQLATVAQTVKLGYSQDGTRNAVRTYDTHGTEHKGFRKDEKDFEESKRAKGH